jgi:hypothetical protein
MNKQAIQTKSGSDQKQSGSAGVIENVAPPAAAEASPEVLSREHEERKEEQKGRIEETDRETLLRMLYQMVLIRRFEEKSAEAYSLGKIGAARGRLRADQLS